MKPGVTFEWYLKTFYNLNVDELPDNKVDSYRMEFEIWQEASGQDKVKMWPDRTRLYNDVEDKNETYL